MGLLDPASFGYRQMLEPISIGYDRHILNFEQIVLCPSTWRPLRPFLETDEVNFVFQTCFNLAWAYHPDHLQLLEELFAELERGSAELDLEAEAAGKVLYMDIWICIQYTHICL